MPYCKKCGHFNDDTNQFCINCGASLSKGSSSASNQSSQTGYSPYTSPEDDSYDYSYRASKKKSSNQTALIAGGIIACAVVLGGLFYFDPMNLFSSSDPVVAVYTDSEDSESSQEPVSRSKPVSREDDDDDVSQEVISDSAVPSIDRKPVPDSTTPSKEPDNPVPAAVTPQPEAQTYSANYVMKIRTAPSLDASQIGRLQENGLVSIDKTQQGANSSLWGRIQGTDNWICIYDADMVYLSLR